MGVFDFFKRKPLTEDDLQTVVAPKRENFLAQFLPDDPDKREAVAKALIMGGASAMAAGGPSDKPQNFMSVLGNGLAGGVGAYDESLVTKAKIGASRADTSKIEMAQANAKRAQTFIDKYGPPGPEGYSQEALSELLEIQMANGDEAGARDTVGLIQQLQQTAAKAGMVVGDGGSFELAPGYADGLFSTKKAESLGAAIGDNAKTTTDQKNFAAGQENPAFREYELQQKKASASNTTINTNPKDGKVFDEMTKEREGALSAVSGLQSVYTARNAVNSGIVSGSGAEYVLGLRKVGAALGVGDTETITNTETFRAAIAPAVAAMLKDVVGSANISNSDREFAEKAAGGSITLDQSSILRILDILERANKGKIERYKSRVDALYPDDGENNQSRSFLADIEVPKNPYDNPDQKPAEAVAPTAAPSAASQKTSRAIVTVSTPEEYEKLAPGTRYNAVMNGKVIGTRVKQ